MTRLEAVLAKMIELEASQDPYMLQVVIWFPPYFPPFTLYISLFFVIFSSSINESIIKLLVITFTVLTVLLKTLFFSKKVLD